MENIFQFRKDPILGYRTFSTSLTKVMAPDSKDVVDPEHPNGRHWQKARYQLNSTAGT